MTSSSVRMLACAFFLAASCGLAAAAYAAPGNRADCAMLVDPVHRLAERYDAFAAVPNDPRGRVVYGTSRGYLHVLENRAGSYQSIWTSPSLSSRVREVLVANLTGDSTYVIIAYTVRGTLYAFSLEGYNLLWQTSETQFTSIEALTVGQVDGDPQKEILFLSEGQLFIYDGMHFVEQWRSDVRYEARDVAVGDVDGDGEPEIVLSSGQVLDAFSRTLEWDSPDAFGDTLMLADIDGDGKLEVIAGSAESTRIWDIDQRREKWD